MINIEHIEINISDITALIKLSLVDNIDNYRIFIVKLPELSPTNQEYAINITKNLDWSNTTAGKYYHLQDNILTETPVSPGSTYKFNYTTYKWEDTRSIDEMWLAVKSQRNSLLNKSDWTQMPDVPLTTKSDWAVYRQQLRDVTSQPDPFNITWPTPPGA